MDSKQKIKTKIKNLKLAINGNKVKKVISLLRYDLLSKLLETADERKKRILIERYKNSGMIKQALINQYYEIDNSENSRKIFSPGTFVGLQGKLNCAILSRFVIENIWQWDFSMAVHKVSYKRFYKYHLRCVEQCFDNLYDLLIMAYPERNLKPYYFKNYKNIWKDEKGYMREDLVKEAIREFVDILTNPRGKYRYKFKGLPKWINYKLFQKKILPYDNSLSYMLSSCFGNSPIKAIIFAYPELNLKPYYFSHVPKFFWSGKEGIKNAEKAMKEFIHILIDPKGKYQFTLKEVLEILKYKTYHKPILPYGKKLGGMLQVLFKNSPHLPLALVDSQQEMCARCRTIGLPNNIVCDKFPNCQFPKCYNSDESFNVL